MYNNLFRKTDFGLNKTILQFIKFSFVGLSNTLISYGIYALLVYFGLHYIIASILAFFISVLNSFFWNDKYVFGKSGSQERNVIYILIKTYISYTFTGLILGNVLLFVFIDIMQISKYIAPFLGLLVTVPLNFILNKLWTFKPTIYTKDEIKKKSIST